MKSTFFLIFFFISTSIIAQICTIIPQPNQVVFHKGVFKLNSSTVITPSSISKDYVYLQTQIKNVTGFDLEIISENYKAPSTLNLVVDSTLKIGNEAYELNIATTRCEIKAKSSAGLFYGIQSFLQLLPPKSNMDCKIPCQTIKDSPRFAWRGMHLDVSRHFQTKEFVKKFIDILSLHKLNVFHWHLTDDQGWRIEIKKYPKLTSVGAWREDRRGEIWNIDDEQREPYQADKPYYGGFYTQDDIREIVRYAAERSVQIIPEIEMPGHSRAALVAYPEFSCFGRDTKVASGAYVGDNWDFSDPYCAGNDQTFTFLQNVLDEVMDLFPSQYIHVGGDECSKRIWKTCPKCQQRIVDNHLQDEFELQSYFIRRIEQYINSKGKRMIGWQEILEGGMNPSAIIQPWKDETALEIALEAAESGHKLIMSPSTHLYFDKPWNNNLGEGAIDLYKTYHYEPIPEGLNPAFNSYIKGVEGCLWAEHTPQFSDVEYQTMPRIAALAEIAWTETKNKNWEGFQKRFNLMLGLYKRTDINYYLPSPTGFTSKTVFFDKATFRLDKPAKNHVIRYTTNGTEPTINGLKYNCPFAVKKTVTLKLATFDQFGHKSKTKTAMFEKQEYIRAKNPVGLKPGLLYQLYSGKIRGTDEITQAKQTGKGITNVIQVIDNNGKESGGIILTGYILVPEKGLYSFSVSSDDGSKLYIGNYCVVDNDGFHAGKNKNGDLVFKSGKVALEKGVHPIEIRYFDWGEGEILKIIINGPGIHNQEIAGCTLFH